MNATVALVSGSVRGLGLACARRLAADGARVHVVWRSSAELAGPLQAEFAVHRADLTDAEQCRRLVQDVIARDGRLDTLVHAVGEYATGPIETQGAELARDLWASNVGSALALFGAARAPLRAARGAAVFFGCAGCDHTRAWRDIALYAAAKTALLVVVRSLAVEEAPHGVRVNMLSPGHIPHAHAAPDTNDPQLWARIPMGVPGEPRDAAEAVAWLCSPAARYVTGTNLALGGGWRL